MSGTNPTPQRGVRRRHVAGFFLLLLVAGVGLAWWTGVINVNPARIDDLRAKISGTGSPADDLKAQLAEAQAQLAQLQAAQQTQPSTPAPLPPAATANPQAASASCAVVSVNNPFIPNDAAKQYFLTVMSGAGKSDLEACARGAQVMKAENASPAIRVAQGNGGHGLISLPNRALRLVYGNNARQCWGADFAPGATDVVLKPLASCPTV